MIPFAIPAAVSRLPWKLIAAGVLLAIILVQTIRLERAERRADRLEFSLNEARQALKDADLKTREAQKETERLLGQMRERGKSANDKASRIERIVLPGDCKTPRQIMEMDGL